MAKAKAPDGGESLPKGCGGKPQNARTASARAPKKRNRKVEWPPRHPISDFEQIAKSVVAKSVVVDPPRWLAEHLRRWSSSILLDYAVEDRQPARAEMRAILAEISRAALLLQRALGEPTVREFLDAGGNGPIPAPGNLDAALVDVRDRAERASLFPTLVNAKGKTKAGPGRAALEGAISPQTYCALLVAETWKHFGGDYPGARNQKAAKAAEDYWRLSGCERRSWSRKPLNAWRPHFETARSAKLDGWRAEYRRHLIEAAAQARALEPENRTEGGM